MPLTPDQQADADRVAAGAFSRTSVGVPGTQMFNSTLPGSMQPQPRDPNAPMSYGDQMSRLGGALAALPAWLVSAPGSGGPLDFKGAPSIGTPAAAATLPANGAGAGRGAVNPPAVDPTASLPKLPTTAAKPKTGAAAPAAAAPAPNPLVPGQTGFYVGDQLVPYGTTLTMRGDGSVGGLPGQGGAGGGVPGQGSLIDPRSYFDTAVSAQMRFADSAAQKILEQAGSGNQLGYSARLRALAGVYLNGLAGVGQGGANTFNSVLGSLQNTQVDAAARRFAASAGLTGDLARSQAQVQSAGIASQPGILEAGNRRYELETGSVPVGTGLGRDAVTGMSVPETLYGQRPPRAGAMPAAYDNTPAAQRPQVGKTYVDKAGNRAVYNADGTYTPVK